MFCSSIIAENSLRYLTATLYNLCIQIIAHNHIAIVGILIEHKMFEISFGRESLGRFICFLMLIMAASLLYTHRNAVEVPIVHVDGRF